MKRIQKQVAGMMIGSIVGDCVGAYNEFMPREQVQLYPRTPENFNEGKDVWGHTYGHFTDDSSMSLCMVKSLTEKGFDVNDQRERFKLWMNEGYLSSTGKCFDIGHTTSSMLRGIPINVETSKGNGSLMRIHPLAYWLMMKRIPGAQYAAYVDQSSKITHPSSVCTSYCTRHIRLLVMILRGATKAELLQSDSMIAALTDKHQSEIKSSGYVVDTFEAAWWAFLTTDTFEDGLFKAINLGDDADTVGAVYGAIAGAFYGLDAIEDKYVDPIIAIGKINQMLVEYFYSLTDIDAEPAEAEPA